MDFLVLGPVEVCAEGRTAEISRGMEERLVAALALEAGRRVTTDTLITRLWDDLLPKDPRANIHTRVRRLRVKLGELCGEEAMRRPALIAGRKQGYVLDVPRSSIDWYRFLGLYDEARAAEGDHERVVGLLRRARSLWRGEALDGLVGMWPEQARHQLTEKYVDAAVLETTAALHLDRFTDVIADLTPLTSRHPGDERLAVHLMLACYGEGRYPAAMRAYRRTEEALRVEWRRTGSSGLLARAHLGITAGEPVRELVRALAPTRASAAARPPGRAPGADAVPDTTPSTAPAAAVGEGRETCAAPVRTEPVGDEAPPRALPPRVLVMGRRAEWERLRRVAQTSGTTRLVVLSGMGGVGKSALAIHAAHHMAEQHPDGALHVNLRAHAGTQGPLTPEAALKSLLGILRGSTEPLPGNLPELTALWRTLLWKRRCVIVLDDARDTEQVVPLLPGNSGCLTIVTSRRQLDGLPDAVAMTLDVLRPQDAIAMFRSIVGEERTRDLAEVAKVIRLCGCLPLAVKLAAHRLRGRPAWDLGTLRERLERDPGRLHELRDAHEGLERTFAMSYEDLSPEGRTAFRRLSEHPGPELSLGAASALLDLPPHEAERLMEELLSTHMLMESAPNWYTSHDLLAEYARLLAEREDTRWARDTAMARLASFYRAAAAHACELAYPSALRPAAPPPAPVSPLPFRARPADARVWFTKERGVLIALEEYTRTHGSAELAASLAQYLFAPLGAESDGEDARRIAAHTVGYWRGRSQPAPLCRALLALSEALVQLSDYQGAKSRATEVLTLAGRTGDSEAEGEALRVLGVIEWHQGEWEAALSFYESSLRIKQVRDQPLDVARMHNNVGIAHLYLNRFDTALSFVQLAIRQFRKDVENRLLGRALSNLSTLYLRAGDIESARRSIEESVPLLQATGSAYEIAMANSNLADLTVIHGDPEKARLIYRESLASARARNDPKGQAVCLNGLGDAYHAMGAYSESRRQHNKALDIALRIGATQEASVATDGIRRAEHALGEQPHPSGAPDPSPPRDGLTPREG